MGDFLNLILSVYLGNMTVYNMTRLIQIFSFFFDWIRHLINERNW